VFYALDKDEMSHMILGLPGRFAACVAASRFTTKDQILAKNRPIFDALGGTPIFFGGPLRFFPASRLRSVAPRAVIITIIVIIILGLVIVITDSQVKG
jgi:hypothetical protein